MSQARLAGKSSLPLDLDTVRSSSLAAHQCSDERLRNLACQRSLLSQRTVQVDCRIEAASPNVHLMPGDVSVTTERADGSRQVFAFKALIAFGEETHAVEFSEHEHHDEHSVDARDHNIRAAYIHVMADAAVSVLAIIGLLLAKTFGWLWMDPLAGIVGAFVIANWSYGLIRVTGALPRCSGQFFKRRLTDLFAVRKTPIGRAAAIQ